MAVETPEPMEIEASSSNGVRQVRTTHRVKCTSKPTGADSFRAVLAEMAAIGYYDGAPAIGFPGMWCTSVSARVAKSDIKASTWYWQATSLFTAKPSGGPNAANGGDPSNSSEKDPTKRNARVSIRQYQFNEPVRKDENGEPVTNSAGDPVRRDKMRSRLIVTIDKAVSIFPANYLEEAPIGFMHSRNLQDWNPFGSYGAAFGNYVVRAKTGRMNDLTLDVGFENGALHAQCHAEIHVDPDFHRDRFWDEGFRGYIDEDDEEAGIPLRQLQDSRTGMFLSRPAPLNGKGVQLNDNEELVELVKQYYHLKDWEDLPL